MSRRDEGTRHRREFGPQTPPIWWLRVLVLADLALVVYLAWLLWVVHAEDAAVRSTVTVIGG